jgi:hypothetical protein
MSNRIWSRLQDNPCNILFQGCIPNDEQHLRREQLIEESGVPGSGHLREPAQVRRRYSETNIDYRVSLRVYGLLQVEIRQKITRKMAKIAADAIPKLKQQIDDLTSDPDGAPGIIFTAVNKNGDDIFSHASGKIGVGKSGPMTLDSVFWLSSCTKIITSIAALQLVEQGKLSLDDSDQVERLAPVGCGFPLHARKSSKTH